PELPIVVGYWSAAVGKDSLEPPEGDRATKVATTLGEAVTLVRTGAAQLKLAENDVSQEARTAS
ncbi:MAG TPA: hypothetical protein VGK58_14195, partial [Lacipirellulaceae bacterium]